MSTRLNEIVQRVRHLAEQEARRLRHDYVGTEHLLLALLRMEQCVAARVLRRVGIELGRAREETVRVIEQTRPWQIASRLPLTPRAKQVIRYAEEATERLGHTEVNTGHVLLGLLREED